MGQSRRPLFSVTAADCDWSYTKGTGAGGQKKNKTSSAVHCMHRPSKAKGFSQESRSQAMNKQLAFVRMYETKEFQKWLNVEFMKRAGIMAAIDRTVEVELEKITVEVKVDGKWVQVDKNKDLSDSETSEKSEEKES